MGTYNPRYSFWNSYSASFICFQIIFKKVVDTAKLFKSGSVLNQNYQNEAGTKLLQWIRNNQLHKFPFFSAIKNFKLLVHRNNIEMVGLFRPERFEQNKNRFFLKKV